jgi:heme/copper-type cytochrome/quinol oxidase subunit 4
MKGGSSMAKKRFGYGSFYCWNCGDAIEKGTSNCPNCHALYEGDKRYGNIPLKQAGGIGWSNQTNHPRFKEYASKNKKYSIVFLIIISILIPFIILIGNDVSFDAEMIVVIPIVLLIVWLFGIIFMHFQYGRKKPEWDGIVENKFSENKKRYDKSNNRTVYYTEYTVVYQRQDGKQIKHTSQNSNEYDTFQIGEHVHYHGGKYCKGLEKYDKSHDRVLNCIACGYGNDARNNYCERCGCPILKGQPVSK